MSNPAARCPMTPEDRETLLPRIELYTWLANKCRIDGLLSLEEDIPRMPSSFLSLGLLHLIDGYDKAQLTRLLDNFIEEGKAIRTDLENLERAMDREFLLLLQEEQSPAYIRNSVLSILGEEIAMECLARRERFFPCFSQSDFDMAESLLKREPLHKPNEELESLIEQLDKDAIYRSLWILDYDQVMKLIQGLSGRSMVKLLESKPGHSRPHFHSMAMRDYRTTSRQTKEICDQVVRYLKHARAAKDS